MSHGIYVCVCVWVCVCVCVWWCVCVNTPHMWYDSSLMMSWFTDAWHIWMSHGTCKWVMAHMNESCSMSHIHIQVMSHIHEWVMAHINESWHIWMSHGTYESVMAHMNESLYDTPHPYMWHIAHSYVWHDPQETPKLFMISSILLSSVQRWLGNPL